MTAPAQPAPAHLLRRLDDVGARLAARGDAIALLGLGSAGLEADRLDEHSDLDHLIALLRLTRPGMPHRRDPFEPTRRVEQARSPDLLPLSHLVPGNLENAQAAATTPAWLREHFTVDPAIGDEAAALVERCARRS